jgi:hypothetical protein
MAERIGFEPTVGCPTLPFQGSTLNHSDTSPFKDMHYMTNIKKILKIKDFNLFTHF